MSLFVGFCERGDLLEDLCEPVVVMEQSFFGWGRSLPGSLTSKQLCLLSLIF